MKLGEALQKRNYYKRCLLDTTALIKQAAATDDALVCEDNKSRIHSLLEVFTNSYSEYQRYNLLVTRAQHSAKIPLDDGAEVSMVDALAVKEAMTLRYDCYKDILEKLLNSCESSVCIDMNMLSNAILNFHDEITSIDIKIENALWGSEIV